MIPFCGLIWGAFYPYIWIPLSNYNFLNGFTSKLLLHKTLFIWDALCLLSTVKPNSNITSSVKTSLIYWNKMKHFLLEHKCFFINVCFWRNKNVNLEIMHRASRNILYSFKYIRCLMYIQQMTQVSACWSTAFSYHIIKSNSFNYFFYLKTHFPKMTLFIIKFTW